MKARRRKVIAGLAAVLLLLLAAAVYAVQFTPGGYLVTLPYRPGFTEIADGVWVNKDSRMEPQEILDLIGEAEARDEAFFGELHFPAESVFVIYDDPRLKQKLGQDKAAVTLLFPAKRHYICISEEYFDLDILAHEITHAELHTRLSADALKRIPSWFDEGLAVQNDYREQYSEAQWLEQTENGKYALAPEDMDTPEEFYAGEAEDRRFRYLCAKHEVREWLDTHSVQSLCEMLEAVNAGEDFYLLYDLWQTDTERSQVN